MSTGTTVRPAIEEELVPLVDMGREISRWCEANEPLESRRSRHASACIRSNEKSRNLPVPAFLPFTCPHLFIHRCGGRLWRCRPGGGDHFCRCSGFCRRGFGGCGFHCRLRLGRFSLVLLCHGCMLVGGLVHGGVVCGCMCSCRLRGDRLLRVARRRLSADGVGSEQACSKYGGHQKGLHWCCGF